MIAHSKRGEFRLSDVPAAVIMLIVLSLVIGIGASILTSQSQAQCAGSYSQNTSYSYSWNSTAQQCYLTNSSGIQVGTGGNVAYNSTAQGLTGVNTFSQWQVTIYVVLAAAVVIGLVLAYLAGKRSE
jgi:hypothetical protein